MKPHLSVVRSSPRTIPPAQYGRPFEVYEASNTANCVPIVEVNEHRALTSGAIKLRISADKARVRSARASVPPQPSA
jgi:hypothetical protein